jgi:hypothetical protein
LFPVPYPYPSSLGFSFVLPFTFPAVESLAQPNTRIKPQLIVLTDIALATGESFQQEIVTFPFEFIKTSHGFTSQS